jgi:hypothetical protein
MKAVLGIISGGEWTALIREALNLRTGDGIYRSLNAYLEAMDAAASGGYDSTINPHFRSGIELGTGVSSLMLSLLPGKVVKVRPLLSSSLVGPANNGLSMHPFALWVIDADRRGLWLQSLEDVRALSTGSIRRMDR